MVPLSMLGRSRAVRTIDHSKTAKGATAEASRREIDPHFFNGLLATIPFVAGVGFFKDGSSALGTCRMLSSSEISAPDLLLGFCDAMAVASRILIKSDTSPRRLIKRELSP